MWTTRNIALLIGGGGAVAAIAFFGGRRVESEATKSAAPPAVDAAAVAPSTRDPAPATSGIATADGAPNAPLMPMGNPTTAGDLFTRLQAERDSRPKLEPTAESVFAAMKTKLGIEVDEQLQVAAFVVGARFCDKVRTKSDVHVVVCEYSDEGSAIKGVAFGQNDAIKGREILRNKTTTCAVHQTDPKTGAVEATRIKNLFKTM